MGAGLSVCWVCLSVEAECAVCSVPCAVCSAWCARAWKARCNALVPACGAAPLSPCRRKRLAELQQGAARPRYGGLEEMRGSDFVAQVTNAGEGVWVVCHLYKDRCVLRWVGGWVAVLSLHS